MEKDQLVKLGDGTFGAVFKVFDANQRHQFFAIKLFYKASSVGVEVRFGQEMRAREILLERLVPLGLEGLVDNLVLAEAATDKFHQSEAVKTDKVAAYFKRVRLSTSGQALVMPLYACNLKDILERGAPAGRLVGDAIQPTAGARGYDLLSKMTYRDRETAALDIVHQVTRGLRALHAARMFHHDLKPANVLARSQGGNSHFALSDFGFLAMAEAMDAQSISAKTDSMPLGTRHYRSPEQKDNYDVCEVDVLTDVEPGRIVLETKDRKFFDTIIETGDLLYFFKDPDRIRYKIESIRLDEQKGIARIALEEKGESPAVDVRTQIILMKLQTARTDLFGVGALLYDLITGGRSPERFYDILRVVEFAPEEDEGGISALVDEYKTVASSAVANPLIAAIRNQLGADSELSYPSYDVLDIVLKCMLSRPADSYYRRFVGQTSGGEHKEDPRLSLFGQVVKDLSAAISKRPRIEINPLWEGRMRAEVAGPQGAPFSDLLKRIERYPARSRLRRGFAVLRDLARLVQQLCVPGQGAFFASLAPDNLVRIGTGFQVVTPTFTDEHQYLKTVLTRGPMMIADGALADNYVPPSFRFRSRAAEARVRHDDGSALIAEITYTDSFPLWTELRRGDLVWGRTTGKDTTLLAIEQVNGQMLKLVPIPITGVAPAVGDLTGGRVTLIKAIRPLEYYLPMLGIYLHQLFFADASCQGSVPPTVWYLRLTGASGLAQSGVVNVAPVSRDDVSLDVRCGRSAPELRRWMARFYLWLIQQDLDGRHDDPGLAARLSTRMMVLRDNIAGVLGCNSGELEILSSVPEREDETAPDDERFNDGQTLEQHLHTLVFKPNLMVQVRSLFDWIRPLAGRAGARRKTVVPS